MRLCVMFGSGVSRGVLVARKPPPPGQDFFLNQADDTILAPTFTSHLNLRVFETPLRPTLDRESWTAYSKWVIIDLCIDHLQHTEAEVIVEQMGSFEEDGALLITVMMQMQPFRNYLLDRLIIE